MRKISLPLFAMFIAFFPVILFSQQKKPVNAYSSLTTATAFFRRTALVSTVAGMSMRLGADDDIHSLPPEGINKVIDELVGIIDNKSGKALSKKYLPQIKKYYAEMSTFGDAKKDITFVEKTNTPFEFITNNGGLTFCQYGIFASNEYNTLRTTADERARTVAKDILVPGLTNFEPLLNIAEIKYFAIMVTYNARDFSEDHDWNFETTVIVTPKSVIRQYLNAEITDEKVMSLSSFYNVNKNTNAMVRKMVIK